MSYEITLNWNITTYEVTATGGCEAPTIITLSTRMRPTINKKYCDYQLELERESTKNAATISYKCCDHQLSLFQPSTIS